MKCHHLSAGILFDVDGTLSDSFKLGFDSTNAVLKRNGIEEISAESYHQGTRFTTPMRLAWHVTGDPNNPIGEDLVSLSHSCFLRSHY